MSSEDTILIIGGGIAGLSAAQGARAAGHDGPIALVSAEQPLPYRRPALSKDVLKGDREIEQVAVKQEAWFADQSIELLRGTTITKLDADANLATTADGQELSYSRAIIATGARAASPWSGERVFTLRQAADVAGLRDALTAGGELLVVGAGLIGSEVAATARALGCAVTLVEAEPYPLSRSLPAEIGEVFAGLHADNGAVLHTGARVAGISENGDAVTVTAEDGRTWTGPAVLVALGMKPEVELARQAGAEIGRGIIVDELGRTSLPDVFAAGDCTERPEQRIGAATLGEHWQGAQNHGQAVGANAAGAATAFSEVPWAWSEQYGTSVQIAGWPDRATQVVIRGDLAERNFTAWFLEGDRVSGVVAMNRPADVRSGRQLIEERTAVDPATIGLPE